MMAFLSSGSYRFAHYNREWHLCNTTFEISCSIHYAYLSSNRVDNSAKKW